MADELDLERILAELHPAAFSWALACCRWNRAEAEDVLQTTYLKVLDRSARYHGRASVKTWFFAVVRRTAAARWRRAWLRRLRLLALPEDPPADGGPFEVVADGEGAARVRAALSSLAARQREILDLVFYHDLTVEDAARAMGVSVGAARRHYARAKANLAEKLR